MVSFSTGVVVCGGSAIAKVIICTVCHWSLRQRPGVDRKVRYGTTPVSSRFNHFSNYDCLHPKLLLGVGNPWSRRPGWDRLKTASCRLVPRFLSRGDIGRISPVPPEREPSRFAAARNRWVGSSLCHVLWHRDALRTGTVRAPFFSGAPRPWWYAQDAPGGSPALDLAPCGCHIRSSASLAQW